MSTAKKSMQGSANPWNNTLLTPELTAFCGPWNSQLQRWWSLRYRNQIGKCRLWNQASTRNPNDPYQIQKGRNTNAADLNIQPLSIKCQSMTKQDSSGRLKRSTGLTYMDPKHLPRSTQASNRCLPGYSIRDAAWGRNLSSSFLLTREDKKSTDYLPPHTHSIQNSYPHHHLSNSMDHKQH